jgi:hypothetical protein
MHLKLDNDQFKKQFRRFIIGTLSMNPVISVIVNLTLYEENNKKWCCQILIF